MKSTKRNLIITIAAIAVLIAAGVLAFVWKSQPKGITVAVSELPDSLNPVLVQNTSGLNANELLFDGLANFEVDPESRKLYAELALAESIEQDPATKKTYIATLRDVYWHDGTKLSAADVEYSFDAYVLKDNASPKRDYLTSFIKSVKAVDERTVEIEFHKPIPPFRAYPVLTFKIIPARYKGSEMNVNLRSGENEREFATAPVGTGPYKVEGWEIGKWVSFSANGTYFKRTPAAESLVIKQVIDPIIRMNELRKNRVHLILETSPMDRPKVEKTKGVDINSYLPYAFYQISVNTKLFPSPVARQALSKALERASLVPGITDRKEGVVIGTSPFPSDLFTSTIPEYLNEPVPDLLAEDQAEAKAMAEASGLKGQTAILLYPDSLGEFGSAVARSVVDQLARIGVTVEAKRTGDQVFKRLVYAEKNYELALVYSEGFDNVYSTLGEWFRSSGELNISGIADGELDALFDEWEKTVDTTKWIDLTLRINRRMSELAPSMFLLKLRKDVYSRGISNLAIATDNPFLSVEDWKL